MNSSKIRRLSLLLRRDSGLGSHWRVPYARHGPSSSSARLPLVSEGHHGGMSPSRVTFYVRQRTRSGNNFLEAMRHARAPIGSLAPRITADHEAGPKYARGMLVEPAWAAARAPGLLRAFFLQETAPAAVSMSLLSATAASSRCSSAFAEQRRKLRGGRVGALHAEEAARSGAESGVLKAARGQRGAAPRVYNIKSHRDQERRWGEYA